MAEALLQGWYRIANGDWLYTRVALPIFAADDIRSINTKPNLSYRHQTSEFDVTYYTNSDGFRSGPDQQDIPVDKPDDVYRIILTGPSFAFGIGSNYEEIYARLIEQGLKVPGKRVEIINIGVAAQPANWQFCWMEQVAATYSPDMILQTVYGDTHGDTHNIGVKCMINWNSVTIEDGYIINPWMTRARHIQNRAKKSAIVFYSWYIYVAVMGSTDQKGLGTEFYDTNNAGNIFSIDTILEYLPSRYRRNQTFLKNILGNDIEIVYLHIPFSFVVRTDDLGRWAHLPAKKRDPLHERKLSAALEEKLNSMSFNFIGTTDALLKRDQQERTYHYIDIHLTPAGNAAVADAAIPILNSIIAEQLGQRAGQ